MQLRLEECPGLRGSSAVLDQEVAGESWRLSCAAHISAGLTSSRGPASPTCWCAWGLDLSTLLPVGLSLPPPALPGTPGTGAAF